MKLQTKCGIFKATRREIRVEMCNESKTPLSSTKVVQRNYFLQKDWYIGTIREERHLKNNYIVFKTVTFIMTDFLMAWNFN